MKKYKYKGKEITKNMANWIVIRFFIAIGLSTAAIYVLICGAASLG